RRRAPPRRSQHRRDRGPHGAPPRGQRAPPGGKPDRLSIRPSSGVLNKQIEDAVSEACSARERASEDADTRRSGRRRQLFETFYLGESPEDARNGQPNRRREQSEEPLAGAEDHHVEEVADGGGGEDQGKEGAEPRDQGEHVALDRDVLAAGPA